MLNSLVVLATVVIGVSYDSSVQAQITPDDSLGEESSVVTPDVEVKGETADRIDGGAVRERNLFHSFSEFNVGESQSVYFANPENIEHIFTRVTGNNPSNILGTLGVDGAADLLLLNPNGILFGNNSSLDVEGSFFGTTADSLIFEDGSEFSAVEPRSPLLTISVPLGLQFGSNPGSISVRSSLEVPNGQNFSLVGGDIDFKGSNVDTDDDTDDIDAPGGRVELGGLSTAGIVNFEDSSNLSFPEGIPRANITLNNFFVSVAEGSVAVYSQNLRLINSGIATGIEPGVESTEAQAGDIIIDTTEATILEARDDSESGIFSSTGDFLGSTDDVEVTNTAGNAGNIFINTGSLSVTGTSSIFSLTFGEGNAGSINIEARESVSLKSESTQRNDITSLSFATGNSADIKIKTPSLTLDNADISTSAGGTGNAGNLTINTDKLTVQNSFISTTTNGLGQAGNIEITASDFINLSGASILPDGRQFLSISTTTFGDADAGDIAIETGNLIATEGAQISAGTGGAGNGGNINIEAESIELTGISTDETVSSGISASSFGSGTGGEIKIITDSLVIRDEGAIAAEAGDVGDAGSVDLDTEQLTVENATISTLNTNTGQAGNIDLTASEFISLSGTLTNVNGVVFPAGLLTSTLSGDATAGNVTVNTGNLMITDGAQIQAFTAAAGDGGNITVKADRIQLTGNSGANFPSSITANTVGSGDGGTVNITTNNLVISDEAGITVRSAGDGNAGAIFAVVSDSVVAENGTISSRSESSSGGGIEIWAGKIRLRGDSDIQTNVEIGAGGGGDITLSADSIVANDDSDILAFSRDGVGGNITIDTPAFFANGFSSANLNTNPEFLEDNNRVDINATGSVSGLIDIPDVNFLPNDLVELSENAIDTDELVANSCVVRDRQPGGTFTITGSGGLPVRPGDAAVSPYPTGDVRTIPSDQSDTSAEDNWQPGDPIVEPEGLYRLSNGKLVLSRECR